MKPKNVLDPMQGQQAAARRARDVARMTDAAKRYAAGDRTDPFAFRRAVAHIKGGVATVVRREHSRDYDLDQAMTSFYDATPYGYEREVPGIGKVPTVGFRGMVRP